MYISAAQSLGNNEQFPIQETQSLLWLMRPEWKCPPRSLEQAQVLTVELMEVLQLGQATHHVVEMTLESPILEQAVCHLCQVDANYGIRVPATQTMALQNELKGFPAHSALGQL